jgi:type II secretory pathway pseudopilin PulG
VTFMQRINARIEARKTDEKGLALLDVLLGMAIFALIVVIGVQNFSTLRNRAYTTQVSSDAKQAATAIQAWMTAPGNTGAPANTAALVSTTGGPLEGVNLTSGNNIPTATTTGYVRGGTTAGPDNFKVCVQRGTTGPSAVYDSSTSTVTTASGACAAQTMP